MDVYVSVCVCFWWRRLSGDRAVVDFVMWFTRQFEVVPVSSKLGPSVRSCTRQLEVVIEWPYDYVWGGENGVGGHTTTLLDLLLHLHTHTRLMLRCKIFSWIQSPNHTCWAHKHAHHVQLYSGLFKLSHGLGTCYVTFEPVFTVFFIQVTSVYLAISVNTWANHTNSPARRFGHQNLTGF